MAASNHLLGEVMLTTPVMQQSYLIREFEREFAPVAAITPGAPIEFNIPQADKLYQDLNDSRLRLRCKITKRDGTNLDAIANVKTAPINLLLQTLFKDVTIQLNGKTVTDPNGLYMYRAYMETVLNYGHDAQKYRLQTEGWYRDTHNKMDDVATADNKGLVERKKYAADSAEFILEGRLHVDMCHMEKLIPPGVNMHIKLIPNDDRFVLMSDDAVNLAPKVEIKDAIFILQQKQMSEKMEIAHQKLLTEQNFVYPHDKVLMKHYAIPSGSSTWRIDNVFQGAIPDLVVCAFVADDAFAGSYTKNPFNFQNVKLKRVDMIANGTHHPTYGYKPDYSKSFINPSYYTFIKQFEMHNSDRCINLTPDEWANGYNMYAFKCTQGPIGDGTVGPRSRTDTGSVTMEFDFETAPTANLKLIIMSQSLGVMEIDQYHNVIKSQ